MLGTRDSPQNGACKLVRSPENPTERRQLLLGAALDAAMPFTGRCHSWAAPDSLTWAAAERCPKFSNRVRSLWKSTLLNCTAVRRGSTAAARSAGGTVLHCCNRQAGQLFVCLFAGCHVQFILVSGLLTQCTRIPHCDTRRLSRAVAESVSARGHEAVLSLQVA